MTEKKTKTKIYFWLKVDKKFFDNIFIKRLKSIQGGYAMTVIYIRLMLESLSSDCILYYEGYFENLAEELALKLDVSEDDINQTLAYFTKCGLIQIDSDNNAYMAQAEAMVEHETNWASYKRNSRKVGKSPINFENVQQVSNSCPTEIEIKRDININTDIKSEEELDKEFNSTEANSLKIVSDYFQQEIGILTPNQLEQLSDYITITKMELEVIKTAITRAADNSKRSFGYVNSILRNWRQNGIKTMVQVEEEKRNYLSKKTGQEQTENNLPDLPF
ncbi:DnaD domain protein [Streptococcus uberis]|uniref:DnaD domain protein n=1 Tax=Streptococcus uberis TaxID=1349 RepID=UPI001FF4446A|nr:DnaD domain protein [Streptococcus uberis]MCK1190083.1 DnaD domain protein [Streptococcus uberis]MCK1196578.1 DnaD domain protein [Streptococcus uberis]